MIVSQTLAGAGRDDALALLRHPNGVDEYGMRRVYLGKREPRGAT